MTEQILRDIPHPRPQPARRRVLYAKAKVREELARMADTGLSWAPGAPPEQRYDYWLGRICGSVAYLLWTLDAEDAVLGESDGR